MSSQHFFKYHGLGNDFILFDVRENPSVSMQLSKQAQVFCERRFGIGGDGILLLLPDEKNDARLEIYNADGSRPEMCGNGIRCAAQHLLHHGVRKESISIQTDAGVKICQMEFRSNQVTVQMGAPILKPSLIPFVHDGARAIEVLVGSFPITAVSMGNPHAVIFSGFEGAPMDAAKRFGPSLEVHQAFPQKTNVEFARVESDGSITVAIWERGVGITLACGTGACATAVAAVLTQRTKPEGEILVHVPGGDLGITVKPDLSDVYMRGPAQLVFEGTLHP